MSQSERVGGLSVSVTGLGYVGLPVALAFARRYHVVGFDLSAARVTALRRGEDPTGATPAGDFADADIEFTTTPGDIGRANFHIVAVPTPIDDTKRPDLSLLKDAMTTVGLNIKKGDTVVVESTVYPGCVEEECLPILERESGLRCDTDFLLGYSPERINPGDRVHTLTTVRKIVSGRTAAALDLVARAYQSVLPRPVHRAESIRVAEAAKIIENTQRDVNIALMNELSLIFGRMGIETADVLRAASTKWNFLPFHPGLVGGHCIGIDPYYLDYKAQALGIHTQIINRGRYVNDSMGRHVAAETVKRMLAHGTCPSAARVAVLGLTYKANVADIRNTRVADIVDELRAYSIGEVDVVDPLAAKDDAKALYGFAPLDAPQGVYDAIVVATAHDAFRALGQDFFDRHLSPSGVLTDVYGIFRHVEGFDSWRL